MRGFYRVPQTLVGIRSLLALREIMAAADQMMTEQISHIFP
jgi:hypothetical protein